MTKKYQRGISVIVAIFLITALATLAASGIAMWQSAQGDSALDLSSQRAKQAARAGLEIGFWNIAQTSTCPATPNIANLPGSLAPYTVTIACTPDGPYTDGALTITRYQLQSTACNRPSAGACPNNPASTADGYVEAVATGECLQDGTSIQCRQP